MNAAEIYAAHNRHRCGCCRGKGIVLDIEGNNRPCSLCAAVQFDQWAASRRPKPEAAEKAA